MHGVSLSLMRVSSVHINKHICKSRAKTVLNDLKLTNKQLYLHKINT